jgi:hypothetical protein
MCTTQNIKYLNGLSRFMKYAVKYIIMRENIADIRICSCSLIPASHFVCGIQVLCFLAASMISRYSLQLSCSAPYIGWVSLLCFHLLDVLLCMALCHRALFLNNFEYNVMYISCHVSCVTKHTSRNWILPTILGWVGCILLRYNEMGDFCCTINTTYIFYVISYYTFLHNMFRLLLSHLQVWL